MFEVAAEVHILSEHLDRDEENESVDPPRIMLEFRIDLQPDAKEEDKDSEGVDNHDDYRIRLLS